VKHRLFRHRDDPPDETFDRDVDWPDPTPEPDFEPVHGEHAPDDREGPFRWR
jgi:hypothetical protein